jgi:Protein of unknown function (DUF3754)
MADFPRLRFIPFRRTDIVHMCLAQDRLSDQGKKDFEAALAHIEDYFQREFYGIKQELKHAYAPLDPDADTRAVEEFRDEQASDRLATLLTQVLDRANYQRVTREQLQAAFNDASLFRLKLHVNLGEFEEALLFTRGASPREEEISYLFGLWKRKFDFVNFERVVLYIRFRDDVDTSSTLGGCQPGSTMIKLFQNVPSADVEMLFPNTRIGMRLQDKLLIGVPALVSGGIVMSTKLGTTLILLGSLIGFWLGTSNEPVTLDKGKVLVLLAGLGALGGYLWKQFSSFKNRKLRFTQALTENLYFKLLDNNAGVLFRLLDEAEESECKESVLSYYFLLAAGKPLSAHELDQQIELWFEKHWQRQLDFEIEDALAKLQVLGLARNSDQGWLALIRQQPEPGA